MSDTTTGQRFTQLIQKLGLTKNSFALSLGKTATVIQHLVDERNKPGFDLLCKVFEVYPNVSKDWLLFGQGAILVEDNRAELPISAATLESPSPTPADDTIDLASLASPARRRNGSLLQPADIAATLALAAQPHVGNGQLPAPVPAVDVAATSAPAPATFVMPPPLPALAPAAAAVAAEPAKPAEPAAPAPVVLAGPVGASTPAAPDPAYLATLFHTQQLQHQLALAEQRNQHLLEQQALLKQMMALLQKA